LRGIGAGGNNFSRSCLAKQKKMTICRAAPNDIVLARKNAMKKMVLTLMAIAMLASISMNANASVTVKDAPSCSEWNPNEPTHRIWIEAFLSGIAIERNDDFLEKNSLKTIIQWVNNYCKANPKGEVTVAGVQFSLEFTTQHPFAPR
jgi:hypothetical protein